MDDFGEDVGKSRRLSRLIPAYRATLLYLMSSDFSTESKTSFLDALVS